MNYNGIFVGIGSFLIIGLLHPVVIKAEYYIGTKVWPLFFVAGISSISASLFLKETVLSSLFSVFGFSLLWSIKEILDQKKRVEKGWFPKNPRK